MRLSHATTNHAPSCYKKYRRGDRDVILYICDHKRVFEVYTVLCCSVTSQYRESDSKLTPAKRLIKNR